MQDLQQLNDKLELLRQSLSQFEQLHQRVGELDALAKAMSHSNQGLINELYQAQQLIVQWRHFFDLSLDMLCVANTEGYFVVVNPAFRRTLGYDDDELLHKPFIDFVHPDDRENTVQAAEQLAHGADVVNFDNRYRHQQGHYLWLNWTCPAVLPGSTLMYAIARDVTERKRSESEVLFRAQHDALTGLLNRAAFVEELKLAMLRHQRDEHYRVMLLYLDLNDFKLINDRYGHAAGDAALVEVSHRLRSFCRNVDAAARLGGDEFVLLLQGHITPSIDAIQNRLQQLLATPWHYNDNPLQLSASIGIQEPSPDHADAESLLQASDQMMYEHKHRYHAK